LNITCLKTTISRLQPKISHAATIDYQEKKSKQTLALEKKAGGVNKMATMLF